MRVHKISIITVNLNNLEGLQRTMESVFEQSWQEFEYIVIDGGSTDGSKEYIENNSEKIDFWISEPDKGIYNAMNKAIGVAKGEYLFFLNSGDWLYDKNILKTVTYNLIGCDVLYGNMIKVFSDGRKVLDKGVNGKEITLKTFVEGTINHSSSLIKRNLFKKHGLYDENLKIVSDWKFFLITLGFNNCKVLYLNSTISFFDMTGISNSNFELRVRERLQVLQEIIPDPIYTDYKKLMQLETLFNAPRTKKFLAIDNKRIARKINSIIFRIFS